MDAAVAYREPRLPRRLKLGVVIAIVAAVLLCAVMLGSEAVSARRAKKLLRAVEALRVDEPVGEFEKAAGSCKLQKYESTYVCEVIPWPYAQGWFWATVGKFGNGLPFMIGNALSYAGIRPWRVSASILVENAKIKEIHAHISVRGRHEVLGALWTLQKDVLPEYSSGKWAPEEDRRTAFKYWGITPGGEELAILTTGMSTEKEMSTRAVNSDCLFTIRGCDGLCELLPNVLAVLDERGTDWGGCSSGSPKKCRAKNDHCQLSK